VVVGVGAAAAITGVVLFAVGASDVSDAAGKCPSRMGCPQDVADQGNNGRTLETVGGIMGGIGLGVVAGGLIWHFLEPKTSTTTGALVRPALRPDVGAGYAGMTLTGSF
jgi:hypothetical protein